MKEEVDDGYYSDNLMRITNNNDLPQPIYDAILSNPYSRGTSDISVTDLIEPVRLVALRELHAEDLTSDASELIWSLLGQAMHSILEKAGRKSGKGESEARLYANVEDWTISGQFDYIDEDGVLWDWKFVSVYEYINGLKASRPQQLNLYAHLARLNGYTVTGLRVGFIFRDWSTRAAENESSYPQAQAIAVEIPLWSEDEVAEFLSQRVIAHQTAQAAVARGEEPEECTPEERWAKPDTWAVTKKGNKRATRVYTTKEQADLHIAGTKDFVVSFRPGESTRCRYYCPVLKWCNQGMKEVYG